MKVKLDDRNRHILVTVKLSYMASTFILWYVVDGSSLSNHFANLVLDSSKSRTPKFLKINKSIWSNQIAINSKLTNFSSNITTMRRNNSFYLDSCSNFSWVNSLVSFVRWRTHLFQNQIFEAIKKLINCDVLENLDMRVSTWRFNEKLHAHFDYI